MRNPFRRSRHVCEGLTLVQIEERSKQYAEDAAQQRLIRREQMPPFNEAAVCPKCGCNQVIATYKPAVSESLAFGVAVILPPTWPERLQRKCARCEYTWDERTIDVEVQHA